MLDGMSAREHMQWRALYAVESAEREAEAEKQERRG